MMNELGVFPHNAANAAVLVVDDEPSVRTVVRMILQKAGYDVLEAEDGEKAIEAINTGENRLVLDTVICDIRMPKINGIQAIDYFPLIVLTAYPETGMAVKKGVGIFAGEFMKRFPLIPVEEDGRLNDPLLLARGFDRPNLAWYVVAADGPLDKDRKLLTLLRRARGDGVSLVYAATRRKADTLADMLNQAGVPASAYHAGVPSHERRRLQEAFIAGTAGVVVATNAFGMGIDKPDIRFVIHYHFPGSVESYYQEAGRAGRDGLPATCTLFYRVEDSRVQSYFLGGKYPDVEEAARVAIVLEQFPLEETVHVDELAEKSGVPRRKVRIVLALLKRHGLVREYRGGSWDRMQDRLTSVDLSADLTDYEQRRLQDRAKLRAMINYCQSAQCRTRFILDYFGEPVEADWRCNNCDACDGDLIASTRQAG